MEQIYLDYNATTPIDPEVAEVMRPFLDTYFGNPSSIHSFGVQTKIAVEKARKQVAHMLNCSVSEIIFTSGGTESNNYAIKGAALANRHKGNHIITSAIEHPAVFEVCKYLEQNGFEVTTLPVNEFGIVNLDDLKKAITSRTILVSIMHANNETGSIQPIKEIGTFLKTKQIIFHSDAAQSVGKIPVDVEDLKVDLLSVAGHKLYGPKGIGVLYIRNGVKLEKLIHGAEHEQNLRAGTENVLEIVGLGKACELIGERMAEYVSVQQKTRDHLYELLKNEIPQIRLNGHPTLRLPNTLSVSFPGVEANTLISRMEKIAASAGAACHAESIDVSTVLRAMAVPMEYAMGTIRFSTGRFTSIDDIEKAVVEIINHVSNLMPELKDSTKSDKQFDAKNIKLTHYTHGLGCACKIQPQKLELILQNLPVHSNKNVLVGSETSDDAAVYKISEEFAIVETLDFFTPIVDDPYHFGAIAAANALSDVYAMGAKPLFGLNIVGFPDDTLPMSVLEQILLGANDKAKEAGIPVLGGHTIEDPEPKYGMVVTGGVHPKKFISNRGAKPDDVLILTKPIGTGIISTAIKRGLVEQKLEDYVISLMSTLNKYAAETMTNYPVNACTDVTGFGLMGHLSEMAKGSECNVELNFGSIPFIPEAVDFAVAGVVPGGSHNNLSHVADNVDFGSQSKVNQLLLCDAQTSGGLLIAVPEKQAAMLLDELHQKGVSDACIIGKFTNIGQGKITVI